jgi:hypothetical protein
MATRKAIVIGPNGKFQQLQAADTLQGAGGSATITEIEIDFAGPAVRQKRFTITDAAIVPTSKITVSQSGRAATGRAADENEMDQLVFAAIPQTGTFILIASSQTGRVAGKYKANYMVG